MTAELAVPMPAQPIEESAAWQPDDLACDEAWICRLGDIRRGKFDDAIRHVHARALAAREFRRADYPPPSFSHRIDRILKELEDARGCALVKGIDVDGYEMADLRALHRGIGVHPGIPISQSARGDLVGDVADAGRDYQRNNVRDYIANDAIHPHSTARTPSPCCACTRRNPAARA